MPPTASTYASPCTSPQPAGMVEGIAESGWTVPGRVRPAKKNSLSFSCRPSAEDTPPVCWPRHGERGEALRTCIIVFAGLMILGVTFGCKSSDLNVKNTAWGVVESDTFYYEVFIDSAYNIHPYIAQQGFLPPIRAIKMDSCLIIGTTDTVYFLDNQTGISTFGAEFSRVTTWCSLKELGRKCNLTQFADAYNQRHTSVMKARARSLNEEDLLHYELMQKKDLETIEIKTIN